MMQFCNNGRLMLEMRRLSDVFLQNKCIAMLQDCTCRVNNCNHFLAFRLYIQHPFKGVASILFH